MLSKELFSTIVENTPLVSIDLVVRNPEDKVLLGQRLNRPAKGFWFVPGGRILKDESFDQAFSRLVKLELGIDLAMHQANFLGPFEHHYDDNFSSESFSTHYVVLVFEILLEREPDQLPDKQHDEYRWFSVTELLESDKVHRHTKWYFDKDKYL